MKDQHTSRHPHFAPGQTLSDDQLNGLRQFLDGQNRLTRSYGIGAGIVCGLKAEYVYGPECDEHYIVVSPGYGFSSEGYLICLDPPDAPDPAEAPCTDLPFKGWIFTHVRRYDWENSDHFGDGEEEYERWKNCGTGGTGELPKPEGDGRNLAALRRMKGMAKTQQVAQPVWELLTASEGIKYQREALDLNELHLTNHVLVLFLEKGKAAAKPCVNTDCNPGDEAHLRVRALLVPRDCYDTHKVCEPLDLLHLPRFHTAVLPPDPTTGAKRSQAGAASLKGTMGSLTYISDYRDINRGYGRIVEGIRDTLWRNILEAHSRYATFLCLAPDVDMAEIEKRFHELIEHNRYDQDYHQYFYDFVRDLVCGYNEFIAAACELTGSCWPVKGFPRHLGLAVFGQKDNQIRKVEREYRTPFYPSPVHNVKHGDWERVRRMFLRLRDMICYFQFEFSAKNIAGFADPQHRVNFPVRITPSQTEMLPLGRRAIPYYYDLSDNMAEAAFRDNWQPAVCCTGEALLGYHFHDENARPANPYSVQAAQANPLYFSLLKNGFLRIEGHIGKPCMDANGTEILRRQIEEMRQLHNLEFDLVIVNLDDPSQVNLFQDLGEPGTGLEHMGGVPHGGTFIIVCDSVCVDEQNKLFETIAVADFSLNRSVTCCMERQRKDDNEGRITVAVDPVVTVGEPIKTVVTPVRAQASRGMAAAPEMNDALSSLLASRQQTYYDDLAALNASGAFEGVAAYQAALSMLEPQAQFSALAQQYAAELGKVTTAYARTKDNNKKQAYRLMAERITHRVFDLAIRDAGEGLDANSRSQLATGLKKLSDNEISLNRIRSNWGLAALRKSSKAPVIDQLADMINV